MATWTAPTLHSTGDELAVTDWNAAMNNEIFLYEAPYCNYYNTVNSLFTQTPQQVSLGGTAITAYGFTVSSNNIVVPIAGSYNVSYNVTASVSVQCQLVAYLYQNGSQITNDIAAIPTAFLGTIPSTAGGSTVITCSANDTLGLWASTNGAAGSAGTTRAGAFGLNPSYLAVSFIGST